MNVSSLRIWPVASILSVTAALALSGCAPMAAAPAASSASAPAATPAAASAPKVAAPPQMWEQGRTAAMATSPLAPVAGKNIATPAADIPLADYKVPAGFKVELWASGVPGARAMVRGDEGKIYIGTRGLGRVYEVTDTGPTRTSRVVIDKLNQPSGVEFGNGSLIVMAIDKVLRFDGIGHNPNVAPADMTAAFNLPKEQHHNWKYLRFGPDGKLYVPFGAPCNICELPGPEYAQIRRYNIDGTGMEVMATGVRNSVGFDFHPVTRELWFTNHGRDWLGDDTPSDALHRLSGKGLNYGFPYCHNGELPDPSITKANACDGVVKPVAQLGPHVAAMGVHFYTGKMFPAEYQGAMFIARKGSWNRNTKSGYDVITVRADADGKNAKMTPFMSGFMDPATQKFSGRPAYFLQALDGALLVSDEQQGAIYRISYAKPR